MRTEHQPGWEWRRAATARPDKSHADAVRSLPPALAIAAQRVFVTGCPNAKIIPMAKPPTAPTATAPETVVSVIGEYVAIRPGYCGGKPHIRGHRIKVQHIAVWHERMGMVPAEIAATYPTLTLPAVYAALAYYHSHRAEIDADIAADERFVAEMKARSGPSKLEQRLAELHAQDDSVPPG
jgi:uncharacterized protein (DUF433 family)